MLTEFLAAAPNSVKLAFKRVLEKNSKLLKQAAAVYGVSALTTALAPRVEKTAAKQLTGGALWIADKDNTPTDFKRIFGDKAPEAYAGVRREGYAAKDTRLEHNLAVKEQPYARWIEPTQPGPYVLTKSDGKEAPAFVMPHPVDVMAEGSRYGRRPAVPGHNPLVDNSYYDPKPFGGSIREYPEGRPNEGDFVTKERGPTFLAIMSNGDYLECNKLAGRDSIADALSGGPLHKRLFDDVSGSPKNGLGVFIRQKGTTFQATCPVRIESITTDSDGERRIKATNAGGWTTKDIITDPRHPYGTIWMPKGSNVVYLPPDFIWVPLKTRLEPRSFYTSALDLAGCVSSALASSGAKKVSIKDAGANQFSVDGGAPMSKVPALRKIANDFTLAVPDVIALLEKAASDRQVRFWVASPAVLAQAQLKLGADDDKSSDKKPKKKSLPSDDAGGGGGPPPGAEGDPSMGGDPNMDPQAAAMMAGQPPAPPEPSPTDLAAMEMDQQIQQEIQKLQEKQQMLVMLTQRASEISGGAPLLPSVQTQAMGAPPASQNLATGAPAMPPSGAVPPPGGMPGGMPAPGGMPGAPPPGGMGAPMPGADPMSMGAAPGGALPPSDPSMMGGDPSMMGGAPQPPNAMMGPDGPDANIMSQVNPQFLQGAGGLSPDMFDAAAVASIAQSPAVREMVGKYLPNLEKAVDNLGRVLLSLEMQEPTLKEEIGEMAFARLEDDLRNTLRGLGDLVLHLSQSAHVISGLNEHAQA